TKLSSKTQPKCAKTATQHDMHPPVRANVRTHASVCTGKRKRNSALSNLNLGGAKNNLRKDKRMW
ncbi:MAG: hypothetical protein ACK55Z_25520, partial [bacterium]